MWPWASCEAQGPPCSTLRACMARHTRWHAHALHSWHGPLDLDPALGQRPRPMQPVAMLLFVPQAATSSLAA